MGAIAGLIDTAVGAATGSYSGSTLAGFLTKFSDAQGRRINQPDPYNTFDVRFKFFPCMKAQEDKRSLGEKVGAAVLGSLENMAANAVNTMSGGLVASLMSLKNKSIDKQHDEYGNRGVYSFLDYLTVATMMSDGQQDVGGALLGGKSGSPTGVLELDMSYYVQDIQVPQMKMVDGGSADTLLGKFPLNGSYIGPENNTLQFSFLNTVMPVAEFILYPWMKEVSLPYWSYPTQPYTTATITIDFSKHTDIQYVFTGCRPSQVWMTQPNQENGDNITRQASFIFDFMFVTSKKMEPIEPPLDKLLSSGKALFNSASKMVNL